MISLSFLSSPFFLQIDLMVAGNQPVKAMSYVSTLRLFWVVFNPPPNVNPLIPEGHDRYIVIIFIRICNVKKKKLVTFGFKLPEAYIL